MRSLEAILRIFHAFFHLNITPNIMNSVERSLQKIQELKSQKTLVEIECMMNKYSHVKYGNKTALEYINSMKNEKVINNLNIDLYSKFDPDGMVEVTEKELSAFGGVVLYKWRKGDVWKILDNEGQCGLLNNMFFDIVSVVYKGKLGMGLVSGGKTVGEWNVSYKYSDGLVMCGGSCHIDDMVSKIRNVVLDRVGISDDYDVGG
jgi:hypothetical protein